MIQYQVKYITHNDRIAVCYLYADNFEEVTYKVASQCVADASDAIRN